jgi:exodeoxyribonuclease-5
MKMPFKLPLNEGQQHGLDLLENWLLDPDAPPIFRLRGRAGTGKSVLVAGLYESVNVLNEVLNSFDFRQCAIYLTATTNQAAEELNSKIKEATVTTIHSLLNLTVHDYNGVSQLVIRKNHTVIDQFPFSVKQGYVVPLVIIDEASYVSEELMEHLSNLLDSLPLLRILFVYDHKQLLPVGEDSCYIDNICDETNSILYELTQNERFLSGANSAIATAADLLCSVIENDNLDIPDILEGEDLQFISSNDAMNICLKHFNEPEYSHNPYHCLYLAHTNANVVESNSVLHSELKGNTHPLHTQGIHLISNNIVYPRGSTQIPLVRNNQKVTVLAGHYSEFIEHDITVVYMNLMVSPSSSAAVAVASDSYAYLERIKKAQKEKDWKVYYALKENVADLRLSYGSTVYKAQGKSCNFVIVDVQDILDKSRTWDEAKRLLYVAITRARKKVYLIMD